MSSALEFNKSIDNISTTTVSRDASKRRKKRKSQRLRHHMQKKNKSKKRKKRKRINESASRKRKKNANIFSGKQKLLVSNTDNNNNKASSLPIITEEDDENGSFSDSYVPTRYHASGFFSYHTWGNESTAVRPPDEDRIVRSGPSLWHWSWDLSFGLYDELYDNYMNTTNSKRDRKNNELYLEDTWLNMEGPIASWQPLFAAMIWFIIAIYILFPVSMIAQSTTESKDDKTIHISSTDYGHFQVGLIMFVFEAMSWITTPVSCFLIFRIGPSVMLFIGILLMMISAICMSFTRFFYDLQFVCLNIIFRMIGAIGFNIVRQSTLFVWSCFAKLDMLSSGLGFCVGPVFGDLLYTYLSLKNAYIVYAVLLFILLLILSVVILFNLLSLQQISRLEIPNNIKNIRKPRYDILWRKKRKKQQNAPIFIGVHLCFICFKIEVVCVTIIGLTALESTLPIYALDPSLKLTVSGALFTFIYLPLLALSALIGLIFAKSSSKYLGANSAAKHVQFRRRGMKYITKTLSVNLSASSAHNIVNISKSQQVELVEGPSWLRKKKKILPSPDISQHHLILLCGLLLLSFGWNVLCSDNLLMTNSAGVDLVLGLVQISIASSFILISCFDSFINGIALFINLNLTQLTYCLVNISIVSGPLLGGIALDFNNFATISNYYAIFISIHFLIYLFALIIAYLFKCMRYFCAFCQEEEEEQQATNENILPLIRDLSFGKIDSSMHAHADNENEMSLKMYKCNNKKKKTVKKEVYIYGTDLQHLCWWKRGLNVRFPYIQWLESGWSSNSDYYQQQQPSNDSRL